MGQAENSSDRYFSTAGEPNSRQLTYWQGIMSDVYYKVDVKSDHSDGLSGTIRETQLGPVSITEFDADQQRVFRTRAKIADDTDEYFVIVLPRKGTLYFNQSGRSGFVAPGSYVMVQTSEFYELSCPDNFANLTVKIPADLLYDHGNSVADHCACHYPNAQSMQRLLAGFIENVLDLDAETRSTFADDLSEEVVHLVMLTLRGELDGGVPRHLSGFKIRRRVLDYIDDSLEDDVLTPARTAAHFGISPSYLHKIFACGDKSFGRTVLDRRLRRCYEKLVDPVYRNYSISRIAYDAGFNNLSHFSKAFRKHYGRSPRDARRAGLWLPKTVLSS